MGCDIHLKLEQRRIHPEKGANKIPEWEKRWIGAGVTYGGEFSSQIYSMFARLGNVRNYENVKSNEIRGFPDDASVNTKSAYGLRIIEDSKWEKLGYDSPWCDERVIKKSEALKKAEGKSGVLMNLFGGEGDVDCIKDIWSFHSPNWCTTKEMEWAIKKVFYDKKKKCYKGDYIDWMGLLGAMKGIEKDGNWECRAVFWFDS